MKSVPDGKVSSGKFQNLGPQNDGMAASGRPGLRTQLHQNTHCRLCRATLSSAATQGDGSACPLTQGWPEGTRHRVGQVLGPSHTSAQEEYKVMTAAISGKFPALAPCVRGALGGPAPLACWFATKGLHQRDSAALLPGHSPVCPHSGRKRDV